MKISRSIFILFCNDDAAQCEPVSCFAGWWSAIWMTSTGIIQIKMVKGKVFRIRHSLSIERLTSAFKRLQLRLKTTFEYK